MEVHDTIKPILELALGSAGKRDYFRIPSHAKASIRTNGDVIEGEVENISMNGAYLISDKPVTINSSVVISIFDISSRCYVLPSAIGNKPVCPSYGQCVV